MTEKQSTLDDLCINTIRTLSMDAIQKANSGHPGAPMGLAPAGYTLFTKYLNHNPRNPSWINRDRFVLSGGHASMLLYSLLHLTGYGLSLDEIKNFRQLGSKTPGHPEYGHTQGVETTTGPLGQGFANAVGMAMTECHLAAKFNKPGHEIIDHYTYVMCGDGDLMEGVASEAASMAGHLALSKLICLYDSNNITIEGGTDIAFTEDVALRFKAYNWNVIHVADGNDHVKIAKAIEDAQKQNEKPTLVVLKTNIAYGSPNKQDTSDAHGAPLGEDEIKLTKKFFGWPEDKSFHVPDEAKVKFEESIQKGAESENQWTEKFNGYKEKYPELTKTFIDAISGFLPLNWEECLPSFDAPVATRSASGTVLNALAENIPTLFGGSADLAPSNKTFLNNSGIFQKESFEGRNIRFGVREHAMTSVMSGMYLHGGVRPFGGTFLVFADYMRPAIRVASLMNLPVIYVLTHDSVAVGEDGPTHQPVEHIMSLRTIPGLTVIRPADGNETADAWKQAMKTNNGPVAIVLSRQALPILDRDETDGDLSQGAYVIRDTEGKPDAIIIATGSEVHLAVKASEMMKENGKNVRVVSMPSMELFEKAPDYYQERVLPSDVDTRLVVEAGLPFGWEKYAGNKGIIMGIDEFGKCGPGGQVLKEFGFTAERVVEKLESLLK